MLPSNMTSRNAYVDTHLDYKINQNANRFRNGDCMTIFGIESIQGSLIVCAGLFNNESIEMPVGGIVKKIGCVSFKGESESSLRILSTEAGHMSLMIPGFECKILDTRFMIYPDFVVLIGSRIRSQTHVRIRRVSGEYITDVLNVFEEKCMSQEIRFELMDKFLFVESYKDTSVLDKEPESLQTSPSDSTSVICAILPRTTSVRQIVDSLNEPCSGERVAQSFGFPFPVHTNESGMGMWIRDKGPIKRDIHYDMQEQIMPDDAVIVRDGYDFYHYEVDGYLDSGWGCAYRAIQTMASWFGNLDNMFMRVPSIEEIQTILKRADYAHSDLRVGSRTWIGCVEGSTVLSELSGGRIHCRLLHAESEIRLSELLVTEVRSHLLEVGSPVMIGAGEYAYIVGGVSISTSQVLIMDPHYTGRSTVEACTWKSIATFLDFKKIRGTFVNICLARM